MCSCNYYVSRFVFVWNTKYLIIFAGNFKDGSRQIPNLVQQPLEQVPNSIL